MKAVIIDKENGSAFVMTQNGQFKKIKDRPEYMIGNSIEIRTNPLKSHFIRFAAAALIIISIFTLMINSMPSNVYAYVYLDINPSIVAAVDKNNKVIKVNALNDDGDKLIKSINYKIMDIESFIKVSIDKANSLGFIKKSNETVAITTVPINKNDSDKINKKIYSVEKDIKKYNKNINLIIQTTDKGHKKAADKLKVSAGRLLIWEKAEKHGIDIPKNIINSESFLSDVKEKYEELNKNVNVNGNKVIKSENKNNKNVNKSQDGSQNSEKKITKNNNYMKKKDYHINIRRFINLQDQKHKEKEPNKPSPDKKGPGNGPRNNYQSQKDIENVKDDPLKYK